MSMPLMLQMSFSTNCQINFFNLSAYGVGGAGGGSQRGRGGGVHKSRSTQGRRRGQGQGQGLGFRSSTPSHLSRGGYFYQGPMLYSFLRPQFTNSRTKLERLFRVCFSNLSKYLRVRAGVYPRGFPQVSFRITLKYLTRLCH
jgi:hypothetical protein